MATATQEKVDLIDLLDEVYEALENKTLVVQCPKRPQVIEELQKAVHYIVEVERNAAQLHGLTERFGGGKYSYTFVKGSRANREKFEMFFVNGEALSILRKQYGKG